MRSSMKNLNNNILHKFLWQLCIGYVYYQPFIYKKKKKKILLILLPLLLSVWLQLCHADTISSMYLKLLTNDILSSGDVKNIITHQTVINNKNCNSVKWSTTISSWQFVWVTYITCDKPWADLALKIIVLHEIAHYIDYVKLGNDHRTREEYEAYALRFVNKYYVLTE